MEDEMYTLVWELSAPKFVKHFTPKIDNSPLNPLGKCPPFTFTGQMT